MVGHVGLSQGWVDARRDLVEVWVLSPLSVVPERQREGFGTALVAAAVETARGSGDAGAVPRGQPVLLRRAGLRAGRPARLPAGRPRADAAGGLPGAWSSRRTSRG